MLQAFRDLNFSDQQINRLQDNVAEVLGRLAGPTGIAFLDGVTVSATLINGANTITHKLGRVPQGWIVLDVKASAAPNLYRSGAFTSTSFPITAAAACTAVFWVF